MRPPKLSGWLERGSLKRLEMQGPGPEWWRAVRITGPAGLMVPFNALPRDFVEDGNPRLRLSVSSEAGDTPPEAVRGLEPSDHPPKQHGRSWLRVGKQKGRAGAGTHGLPQSMRRPYVAACLQPAGRSGSLPSFIPPSRPILQLRVLLLRQFTEDSRHRGGSPWKRGSGAESLFCFRDLFAKRVKLRPVSVAS
jgi:hypothetical protein